MDSSAVPSGPDPLQRAADALRRLDLPAAVAAYDELLATSPPAGAEQRGTALLGRGLARQLLGHHGAIGDVTAALDAWRSAPRGARRVGEAIALAPAGPHLDAARWLLCDLAADAVRTGRLDDAEVLLEEALQLSDDGAAGVRTRALAALAGLAFQRNDRERAL